MGKELGVGISQRSDGFYVVGLLLNMDNGNRNYFVNCKSADSGWQIHSIRTNIII